MIRTDAVNPTTTSCGVCTPRKFLEKPVKRSENGYAAESERLLLEYAKKVYAQYAAEPDTVWLNDIDSELSLPALLDELEKAVNEKINEV